MYDRGKAPSKERSGNICIGYQNRTSGSLERLYRLDLTGRSDWELVYTKLSYYAFEDLLVSTPVSVETTLHVNIWQWHLPVIPVIVVFLHNMIANNQHKKIIWTCICHMNLLSNLHRYTTRIDRHIFLSVHLSMCRNVIGKFVPFSKWNRMQHSCTWNQLLSNVQQKKTIVKIFWAPSSNM